MVKKESMAALWQTVFHDTETFVNLFFNRVYKPENTLVIEQDGKPASMLHMIPYEMKIGAVFVPCAYVCGVCTHPSERGKGHMKTLMKEAMDTMRRRGFAVTTLIPAEPWLFDFYKRFGYVIPVRVSEEEYFAAGLEVIGRYRIVPCSAETCFSYFDRRQRDRRCALLHDADDFETVRLDCIADGGNVWVAFKENVPAGIVFETPLSDARVFIKELLCDNPDVKKALIRHIFMYRDARIVRVRVPCSGVGDSWTYGSVCILDDAVKPSDLQCLYMTLMLD